MSEPIHIDDGCSLSQEEILARLEIGLKSDAELHPDFPYVRSSMLSSDLETESARTEHKTLGPALDRTIIKSPRAGSDPPTQSPSVTDRGLLLLALPFKGRNRNMKHPRSPKRHACTRCRFKVLTCLDKERLRAFARWLRVRFGPPPAI